MMSDLCAMYDSIKMHDDEWWWCMMCVRSGMFDVSMYDDVWCVVYVWCITMYDHAWCNMLKDDDVSCM